MLGVVKVLPLPNLEPPVCVPNQSTVPVLAVAERVIVPAPQLELGVVEVISGIVNFVLAELFKGRSPGLPQY